MMMFQFMLHCASCVQQDLAVAEKMSKKCVGNCGEKIPFFAILRTIIYDPPAVFFLLVLEDFNPGIQLCGSDITAHCA